MNFQEQENWDGESSIDDGNFTASSEAIEGTRTMRPSILNKSSMHSVTIAGSLMSQIPQVPTNTQRLDLSNNFLTKFPLHLGNLKQIRLNHNLIERIPDQINDISSLTILRLSHNKITTLPFLKHVRHLELHHNPIKVITTRLSETRLQFLSFDWIPFLIDSSFHESERQIIINLSQLIARIQDDPLSQFIDFHQLFTHKKSNHTLAYSLHKAILKRYDFFIAYMRDYNSDINFNGLIFLDTPLLQEALEESYTFALELFMLRKSNLSSKPVYMMNLLLACQYSHLNLFNFVVGLKRSVLVENHEEIINTILKHFVPDGSSPAILRKVLKYCNFTPENPKIFKIPYRYNAIFADSMAEAILYILQQPTLRELFDFTEALTLTQEPLLHFAVLNRKPLLVKEILSRFSSPFTKSQSGKSAKFIRGSAICRKMLWKQQKKVLNERLSKNEDCNSRETGVQDKEKWLKIVFTPQSTPRQKSQLEQFIENPMMGHKIDLLLKSLKDRHKLKQLGRHRKEKVEKITDEFQICKTDETGILAELWISRHGGQIIEGQKYLTDRCNSLTIFQAFNNSALKTIKHDYSIKKQIEEKPFFMSPLMLCQDVNETGEDKKQCIILKGKPKQIFQPGSLSYNEKQRMWESPKAAFV